jgi:dihydropteroate synthase
MHPDHRPNSHFTFGSKQYDLSARTYVMGILNVTPDSFSDGGRFLSADRAVEKALEMVEEGADFIDVGGESTRPKGNAYGEGADPVPASEELARVLPVIKGLARLSRVPISIDTYKSVVAREALEAGAQIVNDISGFRFDPAMAGVVGERRGTAVLMHIRGTPKTMQSNLMYDDLFGEIKRSLRESIARAREHGVRQVLVDPGIGFAKGQEDNIRLLAGLDRLLDLGCPVLVGPSRKSFIGNILQLPVHDRLEGTMAAVAACVLHGASVVRVHDVKEAKRVAMVSDAILRAGTLEVAEH